MADQDQGACPDILARLREICLALPEAYEGESFGHPSWRVNKKTFAGYERYDGEWCVNFKATVLDQQDLVQGSADFFVAPYVGRYGWVCLRQHAIEWNALRRLLVQSYRLIAPKKLVSRLGDTG